MADILDTPDMAEQLERILTKQKRLDARQNLLEDAITRYRNLIKATMNLPTKTSSALTNLKGQPILVDAKWAPVKNTLNTELTGIERWYNAEVAKLEALYPDTTPDTEPEPAHP